MIRSLSAFHFFSISSSSASRIIVSRPERKWRAMPRARPTQLPIVRITRGRSFGPITTRATTAMISSSPESIPNMAPLPAATGLRPGGRSRASARARLGRRRGVGGRRSAAPRPPARRSGGAASASSSSLMPFLKLLRPLATSPIMSEKRPLPNRSRMTRPTMSQCQRLKPPISNNLPVSKPNLGLFGVSFQFSARPRPARGRAARARHRPDRAGRPP